MPRSVASASAIPRSIFAIDRPTRSCHAAADSAAAATAAGGGVAGEGVEGEGDGDGGAGAGGGGGGPHSELLGGAGAHAAGAARARARLAILGTVYPEGLHPRCNRACNHLPPPLVPGPIEIGF